MPLSESSQDPEENIFDYSQIVQQLIILMGLLGLIFVVTLPAFSDKLNKKVELAKTSDNDTNSFSDEEFSHIARHIHALNEKILMDTETHLNELEVSIKHYRFNIRRTIDDAREKGVIIDEDFFTKMDREIEEDEAFLKEGRALLRKKKISLKERQSRY